MPPPPTGLEKNPVRCPRRRSRPPRARRAPGRAAGARRRSRFASSRRARMVPKLPGGSAIVSRLSAAANDAAGESPRAATSPSMSDCTGRGSRCWFAASARWPSTARYRLANAGRRVKPAHDDRARGFPRRGATPARRAPRAARARWCRRRRRPSCRRSTPARRAAPRATWRARPESAEASKSNRPGRRFHLVAQRARPSPRRSGRAASRAQPVIPRRAQIPHHLVEDRRRDAEGLRRRHLGEMGRDVVGGRLAAGLGEPSLAESDEDARVATRARRVVAMA